MDRKYNKYSLEINGTNCSIDDYIRFYEIVRKKYSRYDRISSDYYRPEGSFGYRRLLEVAEFGFLTFMPDSDHTLIGSQLTDNTLDRATREHFRGKLYEQEDRLIVNTLDALINCVMTGYPHNSKAYDKALAKGHELLNI